MLEYSMEWSTRPRNASGPLPWGNVGSLGTPYLPMQRIRKSNLYVYGTCRQEIVRISSR